MLSRALPLIVLALMVGLLVHPPGAQVEPVILLFGVCILVPLGLFGVRRGYRQLVTTYQGFRLFVSHDRLRRVQPGLPDLEIARGEVTRIVDVPHLGRLAVKEGSPLPKPARPPLSLTACTPDQSDSRERARCRIRGMP
jgi:hypothetical protein